MSTDLFSGVSRIRAILLLVAGIVFMSSCRPAEPDPEAQLDLLAAALRRLFENDVVSTHPSERAFFAISLEGRVDPPPALLRRLASSSTEVVPYSEAQTHPARKLTGEGYDAAGVYFIIERVEWVTSSHAIVDATVGSGGLGALYRLELRRTEGTWECMTLKRIAIS